MKFYYIQDHSWFEIYKIHISQIKYRLFPVDSLYNPTYILVMELMAVVYYVLSYVSHVQIRSGNMFLFCTHFISYMFKLSWSIYNNIMNLLMLLNFELMVSYVYHLPRFLKIEDIIIPMLFFLFFFSSAN